MADITVHLVINGRVQGVAYRAWAVQEARRRGLSKREVYKHVM